MTSPLGHGATAAFAPLAGIRVLDLSAYLPGPYATRLLADLGADVIKIEHPAGDPILRFMPGVHEFLNRGKRIVHVDLKDPVGREFVLDVARQSQVLVEAFRPGVVDRLGLGRDALAAVAPEIVYCSISSHGQDGPARDRPGHNIGFEAAGGTFAAAVSSGDVPHASPTAVADTGAGLFGALAICAALAGPKQARSLHLDVSLEEVVTYLSVPRWPGGVAGADGTSATHSPGNGLFRTADGRYLALAGVEDHLWADLCRWLGLDALTRAPWDRHAGRMADRESLRAQIAARVGERSAHEWLAAADGTHVPVELVRSSGEVLGDEHLRARGFVRDAAAGTATVVDHPVRIDDRRSFCGDSVEDGDDVLAALVDELGIGPAERDRYRASSAFKRI